MKKALFSSVLLTVLVCFAAQATGDGAFFLQGKKKPQKPSKETDTRTLTVCQLSGEIAPLPSDHPAAAYAGLPVVVHVLWESIISDDPDRMNLCAGGEFKLNVGGELIQFPMSDVTCTWTFDDNGLTGEVELTREGSPFSPTLLAFGTPIDPRPPTFTGLDELVISGNCYLMSSEEIPVDY